MVVFEVPVNNCTPVTIVLGRRGTYNTQEVTFDLSYLVENYGAGTAALMVKRSQDTSAYPAVVSQEGNTLTWGVSDVDTYYPGSGECELMWYVDEGLAKTIIYPMVVMRDILQTTEEPPDGYENWIEHLTELGAETQQNAQEAEQSATEAKGSADAAEAALEKFTTPTASATTLEPGAPATAEYNDGNFEFGIPRGETGATGPQGPQGIQGETGPQGPKGDKLTYADLTEADKEDLVQGPIKAAQDTAVEAVGTAKTNAVDAVNQAGSTQVGNVNDAGTTQVGNVQDEGATQVQAVEDKGEEVLDSIPQDYSELVDDVADLSRQISDVESALSDVRQDTGIPIISFTEVTGKYIFNNEEKTSAAFNHSNPIAVSTGDIVSFTASGYSNSVSMIALSNQAGTSFTSVVNSIDSDEHTYEYTVVSDGYVVVSYHKNYPRTLVIKGATSNIRLYSSVQTLYNSHVIQMVQDAGLAVTAYNISANMSDTGHYINLNGVYSASSGFNMSSSIAISKGAMIQFNAKGYLGNVAVLAKVNSGIYTPLIISEDSDEHAFSYIASEAMNVVISTNKNVSPIYSIFSSRIDSNDLRIKALEDAKFDWFAFATMGVIGDSLASGASNYSGGAEDRPLYSWGKYIEREHGISTTLFTRGGATTRDWLTGSYGLPALQSSDPLDLYVIGLGVNDAYSLGSAYLGTVSDVHVGSEAQNADTYYGNYSKIIAAIKTKSPRAKIMCLTNPKNTASIAESFNNAIKDIAALYTNTYVIDLNADSFYSNAEFNSVWYSSHSTAPGYKLIAENIYGHIADVIMNNPSDFMDIQWIIENHD